MVKDTPKQKEIEYTVRIGWGFFSPDAGKTWMVTSPDFQLLVQLTAPRNKSFRCAQEVVDALNRIYS